MDEPASYQKVIAQNMVYLRKRLGLSQQMLADKAEVDRSYIGYIENAKYNITVEKAAIIAHALGVTLAELIDAELVNVYNSSKNQDLLTFNLILPQVRKLQRLAETYGVEDIFLNNGGRLLQVLLYTGLKMLPGYEDLAAADEEGNEYQIRFINIRSISSFSTTEKISPAVISRYRKADWIFAVYEGSDLSEIYQLKPEHLEPFYSTWETKWNTSGIVEAGNLKIPLQHIRQNGTKLL